MTRQRRGSSFSSESLPERNEQELGSMYDYLAKIILLGPSGSGKSCILHRIVKNEWRVLSSQTIGVEFSSKIIKVGTGACRKRIKLQLWDTAGTERFRSVSRSYYRGAAGAVLVYDLSSRPSFSALPTFLNDARALSSPHLAVLLVGNKVDLSSDYAQNIRKSNGSLSTPDSVSGGQSTSIDGADSSMHQRSSRRSSVGYDKDSHFTATVGREGREIASEEASQWAFHASIPVSVDVSAYTGEGVDDVFSRLAAMILTKIELGEIDPSDPLSGIQYGDRGGIEEGEPVKNLGTPRRRRRETDTSGYWGHGMREWEAVFNAGGVRRRRRGGCC